MCYKWSFVGREQVMIMQSKEVVNFHLTRVSMMSMALLKIDGYCRGREASFSSGIGYGGARC